MPSKDATEKNQTLLNRNLAGLHSMLKKKKKTCMKNVTQMRVLIYGGGREQGRPRSSNKHHPVL